MRALFIKLRAINWGCVLPLFAYVAVAGGIVIGAIYLERHSTHPAPAPGTRFGVIPSNELIGELARCQTRGRHAEDDAGCIAAWAENRRRFFGGNSEPVSTSKSERMAHP
jgi:conjugative transfer region protein TrbK